MFPEDFVTLYGIQDMFYTYISLPSENKMLITYAEFDFESNLGILRFIPSKIANPCSFMFFFLVSSSNMKDERLNCICLVEHDDMTHPSLRFEWESRSRCFSGKSCEN